jgi:methanogenic corrinoid protein MtbC1
MPVPYRIGAVSRLTGISTDTLRAWERRYGAVTPPRAGRGRDYDQGDVERLILLRRAVEKGHAIGTIARLPDSQLRALLTEQNGGAGEVSSLVDPLLAALDRFDYAELSERLGRIAALLPPVETVRQVVFPLMREVGERWHRGEVSVAQEHMISGLVQGVLGTLLALSRPSAEAPKLIYTTPEGELHSIGVLAAAMLAATAGLSPIYLGPNLPAKEIINAARRSHARAVVLQLTESAEQSANEVRTLLEGLPPGCELWLGGKVQFAARFEGASVQREALVFDHFSDLGAQYRRLAATA